MGIRLASIVLRAKRFWHVAAVIAWILCSGLVETRGADDIVREQRPDSWRQDADINDVFFLDPHHGWAVGNQGLILKTEDGGSHWFELGRAGVEQDSRSLLGKLNGMQQFRESEKQNPIRCQLNSVHFIDTKQGWIAGSYTVPYVGRSRAIIMKTEDGGKSWILIEGIVLPKINRLSFQSQTHGWAVGQAGNLFKTGVFYTSNGGQTWSTQGAQKLANWQDADLIGRFDLVTVSEAGGLGVIRSHEYEPSVILSPTRPTIRAVRMVDEKNGWAAGDHGVILRTLDGAVSWRPLDIAGVPGIKEFDFSSLTVVDDRLFVAGNPGTHIFSIGTETEEIQPHRTPISAPIRKISFASPTHGWAVGSLGNILSTENAGVTWSLQRSGAERIGALMVAVKPQQLPLEMMARFSSEENILSSALSLSLTSTSGLDGRSATTRLGCSMFHEIDSAAISPSEISRRLVREIRTLKPNVVMVNEDPSGQVGLVGLIRDSIRKAADRSEFPEQIETAGLNDWQVDRLVFTTPSLDAEITVDSKKLLPRVGHLVEDYIAISRAQLGLSIRQKKQSLKRYAYDNHGVSLSVRDGNPFSGLGLSGHDVPRRHGITRMGNLNAISRASSKQRLFDHFLSWKATSPADILSWRRQMQGLGMGLESTAVGVWMMQLADEYVESGKPEMAAHTLELMVNRVGTHALTPGALVWLSQYYSSDEFGWQASVPSSSQATRSAVAISQPQTPQSVARNLTVDGTTTLIWEALPVEPETKGEVVQASYEANTESSERLNVARDARLATASRFLSRLKRSDPELGLDSRIRYLEAQVLQKLQGPAMAKNQFRALIRSAQDSDPVARIAAQELLMAEQRALPADRLQCFPAASRPRLDGKLDDDLWQQALADGRAKFKQRTVAALNERLEPDTLMLAYDEEFLFVAAKCLKIPGQSYRVSRGPRTRDPNLSNRDRLEITLDLDRDYRSSIQFVVDHRGMAGDRLGGSVGWNPRWYIDQTQDNEAWIVELAIPFSEILNGDLEPGSVVAARVNRLSYDSSSLWISERSRQSQANVLPGLLECMKINAGSLQLLKFEK